MVPRPLAIDGAVLTDDGSRAVVWRSSTFWVLNVAAGQRLCA